MEKSASDISSHLLILSIIFLARAKNIFFNSSKVENFRIRKRRKKG